MSTAAELPNAALGEAIHEGVSGTSACQALALVSSLQELSSADATHSASERSEMFTKIVRRNPFVLLQGPASALC